MTSERRVFNVNEFCKRHFEVTNWREHMEQKYQKYELIALCELLTEIFRKGPTLAEISPPVTIVGDIHGQFADLIRLLNSRSYKHRDKQVYGFSSNRWVFLGDYVDRGPRSLECICTVFSLKAVYPEQYVLLRGNHETQSINFTYGFRSELHRRMGFEDGEELWECFNDTFQWMPLAGLVGTRILCMHGGISPQLKHLDDIRRIRRPLPEIHSNRLAMDLLWADPEENEINTPTYEKNWNRGLSVYFNEAAVRDVVKKCNISLIVRAHQMMPAGFKFFAERKLCTIFSAPCYMNEMNNCGAVMKVNKLGKISISVMRKLKVVSEMAMSNRDEPVKTNNKSASLPVDESSSDSRKRR